MALTYLKGVKTRYFNALASEVEKAEALAKQALEDEDTKTTLTLVETTLLTLKTGSERLEGALEKLYDAFDALSVEEKDKLTIEDDKTDDLLTTAWHTSCELQVIEKDLNVKMNKGEPQIVESREEKVNVNELLQKQTDLMQKLVETRQEPTTIVTSNRTQANEARNVKLPKLDFPRYNGDLLEYKEFWDQFEVSVHNHPGLSAVEKFTYLKNGLGGVAKETVSGLSLTNENYPVAMQLLKDRFGDTQSVINAHYVKLMEIPTANSVGELRVMYNKIEAHLRTLEALGQDTEQDIFVAMIISKLPQNCIIQLEMLKG